MRGEKKGPEKKEENWARRKEKGNGMDTRRSRERGNGEEKRHSK